MKKDKKCVDAEINPFILYFILSFILHIIKKEKSDNNVDMHIMLHLPNLLNSIYILYLVSSQCNGL